MNSIQDGGASGKRCERAELSGRGRSGGSGMREGYSASASRGARGTHGKRVVRGERAIFRCFSKLTIDLCMGTNTTTERRRPPTPDKERRVFDAHELRENWQEVARSNRISISTARGTISTGRVRTLRCGGGRAAHTKVTPSILNVLFAYIEDNCSYTLEQMWDIVAFDFGVELSTSTISMKLLNKLYTVKQPTLCNSDINKTKRKTFADKMLEFEDSGAYIVFYDETNFNLYCQRTQGRTKRSERATLVLAASKETYLQIQCAVSVADGLVHHRFERGSIRMMHNAALEEEVYNTDKNAPGYKAHWSGRRSW
ncbi:hypothetical protein PybrP1_012259 [[Pythium] brassicae (nom. inval.)]|nr:hypothetical protein PybrP1_012259 [[Pythium] brassicae (nom. inval.)]